MIKGDACITYETGLVGPGDAAAGARLIWGAVNQRGTSRQRGPELGNQLPAFSWSVSNRGCARGGHAAPCPAERGPVASLELVPSVGTPETAPIVR
jgi:hypothetical protein